ncbi:hypothetical protein BD779DRAFT_1164802 [Infundibulicybe gibba]|nr:hypothetical protein BD779DRAFT_1164802 [Infundibulicybe gibba]
MLPGRAPQSPSGLRNPRRRPTPPNESSAATSLPHPSQTSLPSIRQLHPYLPPSGMSSHIPSGGDTSYSYPAPPHYASHAAVHEQPASYLAAPQRESDYGVDSDADDGDQQGPPKKKRRRQALSCTECKRRKIKCDRSQPCTPCSRRGEQHKCHWHIVEPVEKYVTRAEYDDLKTRFEQLEGLVQRLLPPAAPMSAPYYPMGIPSGMPGVPPEAVQSYHPGTNPIVYQPMMPPPNYHSQHMETSSQASHRFVKSEDPQGSSRHQQQGPIGSSSPVGQPAQSPSLLRHRPSDTKSPTSAAVKNSPLSLASITTPFNPESQSKNCRAQTLMLGERLRPGSQALEDPVFHSSEMSPPRRAYRQPHRPRCIQTSI